MTRTRIALVVAAVLLAVGLFSSLILRKEPAGDPLDFLPADTQFLIDLREPVTFYEDFRQSRLGERLAAIRWDELLRRWGRSEDEAADFQEEADKIEAFLAGPVFREVFGRQALLALLPAASGEGVNNRPLESLVFISRPRHRTEALALLTPLLTHETRQEKEIYHGRELRTYFFEEGVALSVSVGKGLFLASFSANTLRRCLDLAENEPAAGPDRLLDNSSYLALRKRAHGKDRLFVYGDPRDLPILISRVAGWEETKGLKQDSGNDAPLRASAFFCETVPDRLECSSILGTAPGTTMPEVPLPRTDDALALAPASSLYHFWTNLLDLPRLLEEMGKVQPLRNILDQGENGLVRKTGLSIPEFCALFDSRISL
ncbi:MAG: hypothetical protein ACOY3O_13020, partial [Thermodesulfobacteriota bacterium]